MAAAVGFLGVLRKFGQKLRAEARSEIAAAPKSGFRGILGRDYALQRGLSSLQRQNMEFVGSWAETTRCSEV